MTIAIYGLGRMGMQIARKWSEGGHTVLAHNRSPEPIQEAVGYGATAAPTKQDAVKAFGDQTPIVWIMLPADVVDAQVDEWLSLLPGGSIIVDGGNSDYRLTQKLNKVVSSTNCHLLDVGVSGGLWGYQNGFSMMCGGDEQAAFESLEPLLKTLAAPEGAYH